MKKMNHLKVFGIIMIIFTLLITIGYTMQRDTALLPARIITDAVSIVQRGYIGVVDRANGLITNINHLFRTYEENELLRAQMYNEQMIRLERDQLRAENDSLKELLETGETLTDNEKMMAGVIGRNLDQWQDFITINKGSQDDVEVDMAVLSREGYLIGRVIEVNQVSSRIQLINYQNTTSKVAAVINGKPDSIGGLLQGYDSVSNELVVTNIGRDVEVEEGDEVITSGLGGVIPSALLIGYVERVEISADGLTQTLYLSREGNFNNLDFVILISRRAVSADD